MPGVAELPTSFAERKLLRWLFLFYFLLSFTAPSFHSVSATTRSLFAPNLFVSSRPLTTTASGDFHYLTL
jgi:hypothetical protein